MLPLVLIKIPIIAVRLKTTRTIAFRVPAEAEDLTAPVLTLISVQ